jgi:hypothetical protein
MNDEVDKHGTALETSLYPIDSKKIHFTIHARNTNQRSLFLPTYQRIPKRTTPSSNKRSLGNGKQERDCKTPQPTFFHRARRSRLRRPRGFIEIKTPNEDYSSRKQGDVPSTDITPKFIFVWYLVSSTSRCTASINAGLLRCKRSLVYRWPKQLQVVKMLRGRHQAERMLIFLANRAFRLNNHHFFVAVALPRTSEWACSSSTNALRILKVRETVFLAA